MNIATGVQVAVADLRHFLPSLWFALAFLAAFCLGALIFYFIGRHKGELRSPRLHEREWNQLMLEKKTFEAKYEAAERVVQGLELANAQLVAAKRPDLDTPQLEISSNGGGAYARGGAVMRFKIPGGQS